MTIGDRVLVTYNNGEQREGTLVGETEKQWKVDFDGEEKRVSKKMQVELVEDLTEEEVDEVIETPDDEMVEDVEEPTEEEFGEPVGEPKRKVGMMIAAGLVLGAIAALIILRVLGVI
jgi:hypothetical protein